MYQPSLTDWRLQVNQRFFTLMHLKHKFAILYSVYHPSFFTSSILQNSIWYVYENSIYVHPLNGLCLLYDDFASCNVIIDNYSKKSIFT